MGLTGVCFCGDLRYQLSSDIPWRAFCLCKTCQKISSGTGFFGYRVPARKRWRFHDCVQRLLWST